jgi:hypothetical protein
MPNESIFDRYLLALRETPVEGKTEHTDPAALQSRLRAVAEAAAAGAAVQLEPKRVADKGAPDFRSMIRSTGPSTSDARADGCVNPASPLRGGRSGSEPLASLSRQKPAENLFTPA